MAGTTLLAAVRTSFETLISASETHDGLFPSIVERDTGVLLDTMPPSIPGQRDSDRAHRGSNLMHDHPALRAMLALGDADDHERYAAAVDRYLETFVDRCTTTATGLFPWGEHAYWHLDAGEPGNGYDQRPLSDAGPAFHDHLRLAPAWLWERLGATDPMALQRFADGLDYHWCGQERAAYNRHAALDRREYAESSGDRSCDFPRHGGHYIHDWAIAYATSGREWPRQQLVRMLAYWWDQRTRWELLPLESRGRTEELNPGQTLSLALSLLDAAAILDDASHDPGLVTTLRSQARTYIDGFLAAPHDPEANVFLVTCRPRDIESGTFEPRTGPAVENEITPLTVWGSVYGGTGDVLAKRALHVCAAYRHTGDDRLLDWATAAGRYHRDTPFPADGTASVGGVEAGNRLSGHETVPIVAGDAGQAIGLFIDLYDLTGDRDWVDTAVDTARTVLDVYFDAALPRAAAGVSYYESQTRPAYLLYNLTRLGLLLRDGVDIGPDYTDR